MKKLFKSQSPNELTTYAVNYPAGNWDDFRNHASKNQTPGDDYRAIKQRLIVDQGGLCGYCEQQIGDRDTSLQRVEHYHPKSGTSNAMVNWSLMWKNVLFVCTGGEKEGQSFALPENLSCDAHKNHVLGKTPPETLAEALAKQISPFAMPAFPCLFCFDKRTGQLVPSLDACETVDQVRSLPMGTMYDALTDTVAVLNLNCDRLCQDRLKVLYEYNRRVGDARKGNDKSYQRNIAVRWFSKRWPSFFTTRRILLGAAAEDYLRLMRFDG